jgi:hypothetical protein
VSAEDLESGRALEVYGLVLCENCRQRARAEDRVELYFCDRCHVSVPVYRVDTGEALAGDGRILCLECRSRSSRRASTLAVVGLALLSLVGGAWVGMSRNHGTGAEESAETAARREVLAKIDRILQVLPDLETVRAERDALRETENSLRVLSGQSEEIRERLATARETLLKTRVEFLRRIEILSGETLDLLEELEGTLTRAGAER